MSINLLPLLSFVAVATAMAGLYSLYSDIYLRDRSKVDRRIDEEFRKRRLQRAEKSLLFKDLLPSTLDPTAEPGDAKPTIREKYEQMIEQSGLELTLRKLLIISLVMGLVLGLAVGTFRGNPIVGVLVGLAGAYMPTVYVNRKRKSRLERMMGQLPDAFDLMARVIRAGQTTSQAILAVADEFPDPLAVEFSDCYEQQNLGLPFETALKDLSRRTGLLEIKIFVLALMVQQQTGGNLSEMLEKLSIIIRDRYRIKAQVRTLTAEGRLQAAVLLGLPPGMFLIMFLLNRNYALILLDHPSMIYATLFSEGLGALWIRKIVNFDF